MKIGTLILPLGRTEAEKLFLPQRAGRYSVEWTDAHYASRYGSGVLLLHDGFQLSTQSLLLGGGILEVPDEACLRKVNSAMPNAAPYGAPIRLAVRRAS